MFQYDWSLFTQKIFINAPVQRVYDLWTVRRELENWFLRKAEFIMTDGETRDVDAHAKAGDIYEWMWHGYSDETAEHGSVVEANGKDMFRFVFGKAGVVMVELIAHDNDTEVILTQSEIPDDEQGKVSYHLGCSTGWTFYLANLKSILEGGIDLRNKSMECKGVINS